MVNLAWGGKENGQIDSGSLAPISNFRPLYTGVSPAIKSNLLMAEARNQLSLLQAAYLKQFGETLDVAEAYRSLTRQTALYQAYLGGGTLAAVPGASGHGWARSCDFRYPIDTFGTAGKKWLDANGPDYGWHPTGNNFSHPEAWHYDYLGNPKLTPASGGAVPIEEDEMSAEDRAMLQVAIDEIKTVKVALGAVDARSQENERRTERIIDDLAKTKAAAGAIQSTTVGENSDLTKVKFAVGRIDVTDIGETPARLARIINDGANTRAIATRMESALTSLSTVIDAIKKKVGA